MSLGLGDLLTLPSIFRRPRLTREKIVEFQDRRLSRIVAHAYENVPYYRRLLDRNGIDPRAIRTAADLNAIPTTSKNDLRALPVEETLARGADSKRLILFKTSGSSGEPFAIRRSWFEQRFWGQFWIRAFRQYGMRMRDRIASVEVTRDGFGHGPGLHMRILNAFGILRELHTDCRRPVQEIVRALREYQPDFLSGFAGTLTRVAQAINDDGRRAVRPRAVAVGGEVLIEPMREEIRKAFRAPVYNLYGNHELNLVAWECKETGDLHTCDDAVIVEILKDGRPAEPGERGEVVGTNLNAFTMPFIRYRLGDIVTKGSETCACGAPFSTLRDIQGRAIDFFPLADGRLLHPYEIVTKLLAIGKWIGHYHLVQERKDRIVLHAVPAAQPAREEIEQLERAIMPLLGPRVEFRVVLVPEIPIEPGGKFRVSCSLVESAYEHHEREGRPIETGSVTASLGGANVTHIFVHCVSSEPNCRAEYLIVPAADRYVERALLIARPHDVVCVRRPVEEEYIEFLRSMGIGPDPKNIITAAAPGQSDHAQFAEQLRDNPYVLREIAERVAPNQRVVLNPLFASETDFELASRLEAVLGRKLEVLGGDPEIVFSASLKHIARAKAIELGVPIAPGEVVELEVQGDGTPLDLSPIHAAIERTIRRTGRAIIRGTSGASGSSTLVAENNSASIQAALKALAKRNDNHLYLVDVMFDVLTSPNIQTFIAPHCGVISCVSLCDQRFDANLIYAGNIYPSRAETLTQMVNSAWRLSDWMRSEGYTGLAGFDFVEYRNPQTGKRDYFLAEINPRTNGAAYPMVLMERLSGISSRSSDGRVRAFLSAKTETTASSFRELRRRYGHLFFDPDTGRGLFPYNTGCLEKNRFTAAFLGQSREEVERMHEDFKALLEHE